MPGEGVAHSRRFIAAQAEELSSLNFGRLRVTEAVLSAPRSRSAVPRRMFSNFARLPARVISSMEYIPPSRQLHSFQPSPTNACMPLGVHHGHLRLPSANVKLPCAVSPVSN